MSLLRGLAVQAEVVYALILRETRTRFGAYKVGYLWAALEPIFAIVTFFVLFRVAGRKVPAGMDVWSFIATGIIPYHVFSHSVARVAESINGNKALLFYPHVFPIDLAIARAVLELATYVGVFLLLMGAHALVRQELAVDVPLDVIAGLVLAGALGAAVGLVFCGLGELSSAVERARAPLLRPLFWISGIFYTADALPERARDALLWNPVLHCTELVRGGWFEGYDATGARPAYVCVWILFLALAGLTLERSVRQRIELT
jgi:capsular polysaccharide transport system permease protein